MKNRLFNAIIILLMISGYAKAQEVELKNDKVLLEGKAILKYEKINASQYSFFSLSDDEIFFYQQKDNETPNYFDDDYWTLNFLTEKVKVESTDFSRIANFMNSKKAMAKLVKWLIKEKVIDLDGNLSSEKIDNFFEKFNENITQRTVR